MIGQLRRDLDRLLMVSADRFTRDELIDLLRLALAAERRRFVRDHWAYSPARYSALITCLRRLAAR